MGVYVVYFLDYTVGVGWWAMALYLILIGNFKDSDNMKAIL